MISEDHVTLKTSYDDENAALHHRNKLQFNIYSHIKQLFKIIKIFHNITVFLIK